MEESGLFKRMPVMDAATVARIGYRALMTNKTVVIPGLSNKLLAESVRFAPRKMVRWVSMKLQERVR
jgi:uncharacterized protein